MPHLLSALVAPTGKPPKAHTTSSAESSCRPTVCQFQQHVSRNPSRPFGNVLHRLRLMSSSSRDIDLRNVKMHRHVPTESFILCTMRTKNLNIIRYVPIQINFLHTGWLTGRPAGRATDRPAGRPTDRPTDRPAGRPAGRPTDRPTGRPAGRPAGRPVGRPTDRPTDRPTGRPRLLNFRSDWQLLNDSGSHRLCLFFYQFRLTTV